MTALQHSPEPPVQPSIPFNSAHIFQMALAPDDILVLATDYHDEEHQLRDNLYPVNLLCVDKEPNGRWVIVSEGQLIKVNQGGFVRVSSRLSLKVSSPEKVIRNHKGECTLFTVEVAHGYRLHFLDFVKNKLPEVYAQLNLS